MTEPVPSAANDGIDRPAPGAASGAAATSAVDRGARARPSFDPAAEGVPPTEAAPIGGGPQGEAATAEVERVARAILALSREILNSDEDLDSPGPTQRVVLEPLDQATPLAHLADRAALPPVDVEIFRILVAAHLDRRLYRLVQRLAIDERAPGLSADAVVAVAEGLGIAPLAALAALQPDGQLRRLGLVATAVADGALLTTGVIVPPRVLRYAVDGKVTPGCDDPPLLVEEGEDLAQLCVARGGGVPEWSVIEAMAAALPGVVAGDPIWLFGPAGVGKKTLVASLLRPEGLRLLTYRLGDGADKLDTLVPSLARELLLCDAVLCVSSPGQPERRDEDAPQASPSLRAASLYQRLLVAGLPVVWTSVDAPSLDELRAAPQIIRVDLPGYRERDRLWRAVLPECNRLEEIATRYRLAPGRIVAVAQSARRTADAMGRPVDHGDVVRAVSLQVAQRVALLGRRIEHEQTWDDLVVGEDTGEALSELLDRGRFQYHVLDRWGFRRKLTRGIGLAALFSGPSGTGKTMAAGLVARDLEVELYQVDMAKITSKWIGETEKNLGHVFDAAEGGNVMLLFDEADALFAKRTEVKTANDRHANAEINYLLQRVEQFEGITILTTNHEGNIDAAFMRRFALRVHFPLPTVEERLELWRRMVPPEAALARDVDFMRLATAYEFTGANIRNAVLRAAYIAAAEEGVITQQALERAVVLEYRYAGRLAVGGRLA